MARPLELAECSPSARAWTNSFGPRAPTVTRGPKRTVVVRGMVELEPRPYWDASPSIPTKGLTLKCTAPCQPFRRRRWGRRRRPWVRPRGPPTGMKATRWTRTPTQNLAKPARNPHRSLHVGCIVLRSQSPAFRFARAGNRACPLPWQMHFGAGRQVAPAVPGVESRARRWSCANREFCCLFRPAPEPVPEPILEPFADVSGTADCFAGRRVFPCPARPTPACRARAAAGGCRGAGAWPRGGLSCRPAATQGRGTGGHCGPRSGPGREVWEEIRVAAEPVLYPDGRDDRGAPSAGGAGVYLDRRPSESD